MSYTLNKRPPSGLPWVMLTAYDALMTMEAEAGGADLILVGDSLGQAVLGYEGVSQVSMQDMVHHGSAVVRGRKNVPVIIDMPHQSYTSPGQAVDNARLLMNCGCEMVKLEGCLEETIRAITADNIPVMGHLGYTPQSGTPKVVGREMESAQALLQDCQKIAAAGCCALVLELVPREVAAIVRDQLSIPVIGIGCGPDVDGQVLVITDMWGESSADFKFLRRFGAISTNKETAIQAYAQAVRSGDFPNDDESFHMKKAERHAWLKEIIG